MITPRKNPFSTNLVDVPSRQISQILTLSFVAHSHHGIDRIYSDGERAEQSTKVIGIEFVYAHVPLSLGQRLARVDVPRFELGASTMPR